MRSYYVTREDGRDRRYDWLEILAINGVQTMDDAVEFFANHHDTHDTEILYAAERQLDDEPGEWIAYRCTSVTTMAVARVEP